MKPTQKSSATGFDFTKASQLDTSRIDMCWLLCGSDSKRMSDVQGGGWGGEQRRREQRRGQARQVQATLQAAGRDQMKHLPSWSKAALLKIHTHTLVPGQPKDTLLSHAVPRLLHGGSTQKCAIHKVEFATAETVAFGLGANKQEESQ